MALVRSEQNLAAILRVQADPWQQLAAAVVDRVLSDYDGIYLCLTSDKSRDPVVRQQVRERKAAVLRQSATVDVRDGNVRPWLVLAFGRDDLIDDAEDMLRARVGVT